MAFITAARTRACCERSSAPAGPPAMRLGVTDRERRTHETLAAVQRTVPECDAARNALARRGDRPRPRGLLELAGRLPLPHIPFGSSTANEDRILPDVARTMARVKGDLPQTEVTALAGLRPLPAGGSARRVRSGSSSRGSSP